MSTEMKIDIGKFWFETSNDEMSKRMILLWYKVDRDTYKQ